MIKLPELLCPAGSLESFYAAVNNGADAVYMGGESFSARASATNFTREEFDEALEYAHLRGVKINLTLNTLYKNSELKEVLNFAERMYNKGVDAFIVQDIGVANYLKESLPDIKLNASTQMSIHSLSGVKYFEELGFNRIVLSRELSLEEIEEIIEKTNIEIETFIHGALCVSYSGDCLMSSLIGGRSGNRGSCAQPCRLNYDLYRENEKLDSGHLLSPKDISTLNILDKLVDAGISALKIEGRMKSPEYVAIVTRAYREALDNIKAGKEFKDKDRDKEVLQVFNRGGSFTEGYYTNYSGKDMMSNQSPKATGMYLGEVINYRAGKNGICALKLEENVVAGDGVEIWTKGESIGTYLSRDGKKGEIYDFNIDGKISRGDKVFKSFDKTIFDEGNWLAKNSIRQLKINGSIKVVANEKMELKLGYGDLEITEYGDVPEKPINYPTTEEKIIEQLQRTGNTPYTIDFKNMEIGNVYISVSSLNELRRNAIDKFMEVHLNSYKRDGKVKELNIKRPWLEKRKEITAELSNKEQVLGAIYGGARKIYYPIDNLDEAKDIIKLINDKYEEVELYLRLPKVSRKYTNDKLEKSIKELESYKFSGYLANTYGQLYILEKYSDKKIKLDYSFNVFNELSNEFFHSKGYDTTLSLELRLDEMDFISGEDTEVIVYGRQIMMSTHQCPIGLYAGNKKNQMFCKYMNDDNRYYLNDRIGEKFEILRDCENCTAYILNSQKMSMINKITDLYNSNPKYFRLIFRDETRQEVEKITKDYLDGLKYNKNGYLDEENLTYGHYYRGV